MAEDWSRQWRQDEPSEPEHQEGHDEGVHGSHAAPEGTDPISPTPPWEHGAHAADAPADEIHDESRDDEHAPEEVAVAETAADDDDGDEEEVTVAEVTGENEDAPQPSSRPAPKGPALTAHTIRQIIAKVEQLQNIDGEKMALLANALGVQPQLDKIVVALFTGSPKSVALTDLRKLAAEDPIPATVQVMGMSDVERRTLWETTRALGGALPKRMAKGQMATVKLVEAINEMDDLPGKVGAIEELMKR